MANRICPLCKKSRLMLFILSKNISTLHNQKFNSREKFSKVRGNFYLCFSCSLMSSDTCDEISSDQLSYYLAHGGLTSSLIAEQAALTNFHLFLKYSNLEKCQSILEVGSSGGEFLNILHSHQYDNAYGVEPSKAAFDLCVDIIKKNIFNGEFNDFPESKKFDAIVSFQTIEHIRNLDDFFTKIRSLLNVRGEFIFTCHNHGSFVNALLGSSSPIYDYQHFQVFSKRSIEELATRYGFEILVKKTFCNYYSLSYAFDLLSLPRFKFMDKIKIPYPLGNLVVVFALK